MGGNFGAFDTCGPEAPECCRHGMKMPGWMKALGKPPGRINRDQVLKGSENPTAVDYVNTPAQHVSQVISHEVSQPSSLVAEAARFRFLFVEQTLLARIERCLSEILVGVPL